MPSGGKFFYIHTLNFYYLFTQMMIIMIFFFFLGQTKLVCHNYDTKLLNFNKIAQLIF